MDDLFRFLIVRAPEPADLANGIALSIDTPLANQLADARSGPEPRAEMQKAAQAYLQSTQAVTSADSLQLGGGLTKFAAGLSTASSTQELLQLAETSFGRSASSLVDSQEFGSDEQRLSDTLIALQLAPIPTTAPVVDLFRALHVLRSLASNSSGAAPVAALSSPILLPSSLFPLPTNQEQQPTSSVPSQNDAAVLQASLTKQAGDLAAALKALDNIPAAQIVREAAPAALAARGEPAPRIMPVTQRQEQPRTSAATGVARLRSVGAIPVAVPVLEQVPHAVQATIMSLGDVTHMSIQGITDVVRSKFSEVIQQGIDHKFGLIPHWAPTTEPALHDDATDPPPKTLATPPNSHGSVNPAGIADLLVVRRHTVRYDPGEIAYVENIAPGEDLQRTTKRADSTTTTVTVEQITSTSQERDTQATSRFDLNREASNVLQSDYSRVPGSPNSETYGALVQSGGSRTDASNLATTFGQDITSRAASQLAEQFRTETVTTTTKSFKEDVNHHFDNSAGTGSKAAVYQWLDKIEQAQVFSYGKRVLYDINVPEPGAFLLQALAHQQPDVLTLQKPAPFRIQPDQLDNLSYLHYAAGYGATGVQPPPEQYRTVSLQFDVPLTAGALPIINTTRSASITIPDGYTATKVTANVYYTFFEDNGDIGFTFSFGQHRVRVDGTTNSILSTNLNGEVETVPLAILIDGPVRDCTITIEVLCTASPTNRANWQLRTYDSILQASRDRIADYETRWVTLRAAMKMLTFGQGAYRKRQLERTELQKSALAVLTNQQFDSLNAIEHSSQGYSQPFLPNVEPVGRYVRFLQQSFEWDQMMYLFYPYFWGRKPYWIDRVLLEDSDGQFGDFIRAGSARVIVPVRPGFEQAVDNFMATGTVPTTAELGQLISGEYLPYLTELQGQDGGMDTAKPYGPAWEVRLPTTLTVLRKDATLPRWKEQVDAQGHATWVSDGGDPVG